MRCIALRCTVPPTHDASLQHRMTSCNLQQNMSHGRTSKFFSYERSSGVPVRHITTSYRSLPQPHNAGWHIQWCILFELFINNSICGRSLLQATKAHGKANVTSKRHKCYLVSNQRGSRFRTKPGRIVYGRPKSIKLATRSLQKYANQTLRNRLSNSDSKPKLRGLGST